MKRIVLALSLLLPLIGGCQSKARDEKKPDPEYVCCEVHGRLSDCTSDQMVLSKVLADHYAGTGCTQAYIHKCGEPCSTRPGTTQPAAGPPGR